MDILAERMKNRAVVATQLEPFGFKKSRSQFLYSQKILGGQFRVDIKVCKNKATATVIDNDAGEEYLPYAVLSQQGSFVGRVRHEIDQVLDKFVNECTRAEIYKGKIANQILEYASQKYASKPEYLWDDYPTFSIIRKASNKKWYCLVGIIERKKLGLKDEGFVEFANLKISPNDLRQHLATEGIFAAYHMNKKSWITVVLDGTVKWPKIKKLLDASYALA